MTQARVRVLVADDHPLFRDGMVRAVRERPSLELVGEAADGRAALELARALAPDVLLLDTRLPELDGLQVLNALRREHSPARVLMFSAFTDGPLVHQAIAAGAAGYLPKSAERDAVCEAIEAVARGEVVLDPSLQAGLLEQVRAHGVAADRPVLTEREQQILALIAEGLTAPAVAARLHLAPGTVKTHLGHLYEKLGVSDRAACVAEAMRRGLLE
jgi:two-component system nitrate/nitrite response regulator NarL